MIEYSEKRELKKLVNKLKKRCAEDAAAIEAAPEGRLRMEVSNGAKRYYQVTVRDGKRTRTGITRDKGMIKALTIKEFKMCELKRLERNVKILEKTISSLSDTSLPGIIESMPKHFDGIKFEVFVPEREDRLSSSKK